MYALYGINATNCYTNKSKLTQIYMAYMRIQDIKGSNWQEINMHFDETQSPNREGDRSADGISTVGFREEEPRIRVSEY